MTVTTETSAIENYVAGRYIIPAHTELIDVVNPASGEVLAQVPDVGDAGVDAAVEAAAAAFPEWRRRTPAQRALVLLGLADVLEKHTDELAQIEALNTGKPVAKATFEMGVCVDTFRFFGGAARSLDGRSVGEYVPGFTSMMRREPIGVVAQIIPWNYPLMMAAWKIGPALAAGNVSVLKPAEETPLSLLRLLRLADGVIPPGVLNVITGRGNTVGSRLCQHPLVRLIALTGGIDTGRAVAHAAADGIKRLHLELGGNAPFIVLDDADVAAAVDGICAAGFENSGQCCISAPRILATANVHDIVLEQLVPRVEALRLGGPFEPDSEQVDLGPLISDRHERRVLGYIDRARERSVEILTGGSKLPRPGFFVAPAVIAAVDQNDEIVQQEVFGPVVTVERCADAAEAIRRANASEYGLAASIWTSNVGIAHEAIRELEYGMVWVNTHLPNSSDMPHGGFKQSGYGKDLSVYSLDDYTQLKLAVVRLAENLSPNGAS